MQTIPGVVEGGAVKLLTAAHISEGSRVVVAVIEQVEGMQAIMLPGEIEAEDLEFIQACHGRLVRHLQEEEQ